MKYMAIWSDNTKTVYGGKLNLSLNMAFQFRPDWSPETNMVIVMSDLAKVRRVGRALYSTSMKRFIQQWGLTLKQDTREHISGNAKIYVIDANIAKKYYLTYHPKESIVYRKQLYYIEGIPEYLTVDI